jgi:hypothetical protein
MDDRNREYLTKGFDALEQAGMQTPQSIARANAEYEQARKLLREAMGSNYDNIISDYRKMLQELMHKFKISPLMAASHAIERLSLPENKHVDTEDGKAQLMFMAAALDLLEPDLKRN